MEQNFNNSHDINEAIELLIDKNILYIDNPKTLFFYQKGQIKACGQHFHMTLSVEDFKNIYPNSLFYLLEITDENVDFLKDEEYYRWRHK